MNIVKFLIELAKGEKNSFMEKSLINKKAELIRSAILSNDANQLKKMISSEDCWVLSPAIPEMVIHEG